MLNFRSIRKAFHEMASEKYDFRRFTGCYIRNGLTTNSELFQKIDLIE